MAFDRAQATSNANSKVLRIRRIVEQVERPSTEQMALIAAIVEEYETGVPEWARATDPRPEYGREAEHEQQDICVSDYDPTWPHHDDWPARDEVPC